MKKNKKEYNEEKETSQIIWMIFLVPIVFLILDLTNLGHICFPYINNLCIELDIFEYFIFLDETLSKILFI